MTILPAYNVENVDEQVVILRENAKSLDNDHQVVRKDTEERRKLSLPSASTLNTLTDPAKEKSSGLRDRETIPIPPLSHSKSIQEAVMRKLSFSSTESIFSDESKVQVCDHSPWTLQNANLHPRSSFEFVHCAYHQRMEMKSIRNAIDLYPRHL